MRRIDAKLDDLEKTSGVISLKDYFDLKIDLRDDKVQSQFASAKEAVGIASTAQKEAMTAALEGTKDALDKADINNDKRFDGISQKIDTVIEQINKSTGATGLYVTHSDLAIVVDKIQTGFEAALKPVIAFMNSQTGKEGVTDPMMQKLLDKMDAVITVQSKGEGKSAGLNAGWAYLLGGTTFISAVIAIVVVIINYAK